LSYGTSAPADLYIPPEGVARDLDDVDCDTSNGLPLSRGHVLVAPECWQLLEETLELGCLALGNVQRPQDRLERMSFTDPLLLPKGFLKLARETRLEMWVLLAYLMERAFGVTQRQLSPAEFVLSLLQERFVRIQGFRSCSA
jgi:hypothetical protein